MIFLILLARGALKWYIQIGSGNALLACLMLGAVAQLGERDIRIVEADGSIPFSSTHN